MKPSQSTDLLRPVHVRLFANGVAVATVKMVNQAANDKMPVRAS
jgi:hypothetical protein